MAERHAIVVGGSIAGMCTARVLRAFFDRVTVVDRDAYPEGASQRVGVPQAHHVHVLLARGRQELERLFPGFERDLLAAGAIEMDFTRDWAALRAPGWQLREPSGILTLSASRRLLEAVVRARLRTFDRVELIERATVTGLHTVTNGSPRVGGVRLREADGAERILDATLVVDASGRASRAPRWLETLGLTPPSETVVDSLAGYSTRWFRAPTHRPAEWWWKGLWVDPVEPDYMMGGVLAEIENGCWIVSLGGIGRHYPPADEAGFDEALAGLRSRVIADAVGLAEPISGVQAHRAMSNRFRHYDEWPVALPGFVATGDAVAAFNPVYGQGMTTGAIAATVLRAVLPHHDPAAGTFPRAFFRAQAAVLRDPWLLATSADFRFPTTLGRRPAGGLLATHYMETFFDAAWEDRSLRRLFGEVIHMLKPASALFAPAVLARVASGAVRHRLWPGATTGSPPAVLAG